MTNLQKAVKHFQETPYVNKQFGHYFVENGVLSYKHISNLDAKIATLDGGFASDNDSFHLVIETLALKVDNHILGNSSRLNSMIKGRRSWQKVETEEQEYLSTLFPMVPFSAFQQAGLNIKKIKVVESGPTETLTREVQTNKYNDKTHEYIKEDVSLHFTGAKLFEVEGKYFLFDVDRNEIKHKIFNPFIVQLKEPAKTIKEAYENLKPTIVKKALKDGKKVKRQGEWFFIPVNPSKEFVARNHKKEKDWHGKMVFPTMTLRAGQNRPNTVKLGFSVNEVHYVKGTASHSGREHKDLELKGWHVAVPNTSVASFSITGDVD